MKHLRGIAVAAAWVAGVASMAGAVETRLGAITITRRAEIKGLYDNNIFLTSATPFASGIAQFSHDIGFAVDQKRTKAFAGYQIVLLQYDKFPGTNNGVNQTANFRFTHEPGKGSTIGVTDEFKATTDQASSELVERTRRNQNDAAVTGEMAVGPDVFVGLDAGHTLHHYLTRSLAAVLSRKEISVAPRLGYELTAKTRIYAEAAYTQVKYDDALGQVKDNANTVAQAVASGEFTARLKGKAGLGLTMKKYVHSVTSMTDSVSLPSWNASLTFAAPREFEIVVLLSRGTQEGLYNRYNVSMVNMIQVSRPMNKKLNCSVFGMVINDAYPDIAPGAASATLKRADQTIQAGASFTYAARAWLTGNGQFLYRARASNIGVFEYEDQVISVGVEAKY